MVEVWRDIPRYKGLYMASSLGNIRSLRSGKNISPSDKGDGYKMAVLWRNGKKKKLRWNIVIAKLFVPNPRHKEHVNHNDGDRSNNHPSNLSWMTKSENHIHRHNVLGSNNLKVKHISVFCFSDKFSDGWTWYSNMSQAARALKTTPATIKKYLDSGKESPLGVRFSRVLNTL